MSNLATKPLRFSPSDIPTLPTDERLWDLSHFPYKEIFTREIPAYPDRLVNHPEVSRTQFFNHVKNDAYIVRAFIDFDSPNILTAVALSVKQFQGMTMGLFFSLNKDCELLNFAEWIGEIREGNEFAACGADDVIPSSNPALFLNQESTADLILREMLGGKFIHAAHPLEELVFPPEDLFRIRLKEAGL